MYSEKTSYSKLGVRVILYVVILFVYLGFHVGKLSGSDLVHVAMTKAPCNNSEHALCFLKWDCKSPLKNDIQNRIKTQFPLIKL